METIKELRQIPILDPLVVLQVGVGATGLKFLVTKFQPNFTPEAFTRMLSNNN
jgi:hypothetical protein